MMISKAGLIMSMLALTACASPWPQEGGGGLAERETPSDPAIAEAVQAVSYLKQSPGIRAPGKVAEADDRLVRARRESASGLASDADASYLDAVILLGGNPEKADATGVVCLKQPCTRSDLK